MKKQSGGQKATLHNDYSKEKYNLIFLLLIYKVRNYYVGILFN